MVRYEYRCADCGLPCLGDSCPNRNVPVPYCDECDEEIGSDVYDVDGEELCETCLLNRFRRVS